VTNGGGETNCQTVLFTRHRSSPECKQPLRDRTTLTLICVAIGGVGAFGSVHALRRSGLPFRDIAPGVVAGTLTVLATAMSVWQYSDCGSVLARYGDIYVSPKCSTQDILDERRAVALGLLSAAAALIALCGVLVVVQSVSRRLRATAQRAA
jgi:drug/metabolite transporter superfamily protein YnfA